jgi:predicted nuclease of predicted toxin-antitoxin system
MCLDEHMDPKVAEAFRGTFRTVEASRTNRLRGREESDYIDELYRENAIFVTSDAEFANNAIEHGLKHAGIIFIPESMTMSEKVRFAEIVGGFVQGGCTRSPFVFRGRVLYPGHDGLRTIFGQKMKLEFSWDWLSQMMDTKS